MDFSTRNVQDEHFARRSLADWFRIAMATAAAVEPSSVVCRGRRQWSAQPIRKRLGTTYRHPTKPASHPFTEICLALSGRGVLDLEDRCYSFRRPALAIVAPGVVHCEGYARRNQGYAVLWLSCSGPALLAMLSIYRPGAGWDTPVHRPLRSKHVRRIFDRFAAAAGPMPLECLDAVRGDLLSILAELYQKALGGQAGQRDAGRPAPKYHAILENLQTFMDNHLGKAVTLGDLAGLTGLSPNYLNSLFAKWSGQPIHSYLIRRRMELAMRLLRQGNLLVKQAARRVGYDDSLYFSRAFHRYHGLWPSEARRTPHIRATATQPIGHSPITTPASAIATY